MSRTVGELEERVHSLLEDGRFEEALAVVDLSLREKPRNAHLHYLRATVLYAMREWDEALREFYTASSLAPTEVRYLLEYGVVLFNRNERETAREVFKQVLKLDYECETAHNYIRIIDSMRHTPGAPPPPPSTSGGRRRKEREQLARERAVSSLPEEYRKNLSITDSDFWDNYKTMAARMAAGGPHIDEEQAGRILGATDFAELHSHEFERELELKYSLPILMPSLAWWLSLFMWPAGFIYAGDSRAAKKFGLVWTILVLLFVLSLLCAMSSAISIDYDTAGLILGEKFCRRLLRGDPDVFMRWNRGFKLLSATSAALLGLSLLAGCAWAASAAMRAARGRNLSLGLVIDVFTESGEDGRNLTMLTVNLGFEHGLKEGEVLVVGKRQFRAVYDEQVEDLTLKSRFLRIGLAKVDELFDLTAICRYRPDEGKAASLPKPGDRVVPCEFLDREREYFE